jgi:hypothetical protein
VKKIYLIIFLLSIFVTNSFAQEKKKSKIFSDTSYIKHRANRAAIFSAIIPGAGQVYNKKYWKVPILYGGMAALGLGIEYNNRYYKIFREAYLFRVDGDSTTIDRFDEANPDAEVVYPEADALLLRKDYYRRTRDLMWVIGGVVYVLNIIDAYVDAHLSNFDISDDLSLKAEPALQFDQFNRPISVLKVSVNLH